MVVGWGRTLPLLALMAIVRSKSGGGLSPVVIVPGTGGSILEAKLNKPSTKHFYCSSSSDWYTLWLSVTNLLPPAVNCWCDNIKLLYDPATKTYTNNRGVTTRTPGWGDTTGFEYLDTSVKTGGSDYLHDLVEALVGAGLERNVSIRGSPYDFRRAPTSAFDGGWAAKMTSLVEETAELNGGRKVVLLSHSMGCLYTLWFLTQRPQAWKDQYIAHWAPTSGVFAGAGTGVLQLVSGSNEGIPGVSGMTVRDEQRSYESSMILLPTAQIWSYVPLIQTPSQNFTARDYGALFAAAADFPNFSERFAQLQNLTANLDKPGVEVTHLYGTGVATPTSFVYNWDMPFQDAFIRGPSTTITGGGDGTVPIRSLQSVENKWGPGVVRVKRYEGSSHTGILKNKVYIADVIALLQQSS